MILHKGISSDNLSFLFGDLLKILFLCDKNVDLDLVKLRAIYNGEDVNCWNPCLEVDQFKCLTGHDSHPLTHLPNCGIVCLGSQICRSVRKKGDTGELFTMKQRYPLKFIPSIPIRDREKSFKKRKSRLYLEKCFDKCLREE